MAEITAKLYLNDGTPVEFDKRQILEVESLSQSTADPSTIFYGVMPSTGSIKILDINDEIKNEVLKGNLNSSSINIDLYVNGKLLKQCVTTSNKYDDNDNILSLNLSDKLAKFKEIEVKFRQLTEKSSAFDLLVEILSNIGYDKNQVIAMCQSYVMLPDKTIGTIQQLLEDIEIEYPYLERGTIYEQIEKVCVLGQLQCFIGEDDKPKFISARPINLNKVIMIPNNNQYSDFNYELIVNNIKHTIGYTNLKYNYEFKQIFLSDAMNQFYNQLQDTAQGKLDNNKDFMLYSGLYSDYTKNIINNSTNMEVIGLYSPKDASPDDYTTEFRVYELCKATFNNDDISKDDSWFLNRTNTQANNIVTNAYPTSKSKYLLYNLTNGGVVPITPNVNTFPFQFVQNENEALSNLLSNDYIIQKDFPNPIQIIKDNDSYTIYGFMLNPLVAGQKNIEPNYTGDLLYIIYNSDFAVYKKVLQKAINEQINSDADYSIPTNELMAISTKYEDNSIIDVLKSNILFDYNNGISNGTLTVSCADYYDEDSNKAIDWANGELLQVGNEVKIKGNDKIWRITGRKFRKNACPFLDLEVMEVKEVDKYFTLELEIDMSKTTSTNRVITIPILSSADFYVDWGDGEEIYYENKVDYYISHTYSDVKFKGKIRFSNKFNGIIYSDSAQWDRKPILEVKSQIGSTQIPERAFRSCTNLRSITISETMKSIGNEAFAYCTGLEEISFNATNMIDFNSNNGIFFNTGKSTNGIKVNFGSQVNKVPNYLFGIDEEHYPNIISIDWNNVEEIGEGSFSGCISLKELLVTNKVKNIGIGSFSRCRGLTNITLGDNVEKVSYNGFSDCSELSSVTIGSGIKEIDSFGFAFCSKLKDITIDALVPPAIQSNTFLYSDAIEHIYIPKGTLSLYRNAHNWTIFADKFVEI